MQLQVNIYIWYNLCLMYLIVFYIFLSIFLIIYVTNETKSRFHAETVPQVAFSMDIFLSSFDYFIHSFLLLFEIDNYFCTLCVTQNKLHMALASKKEKSNASILSVSGKFPGRILFEVISIICEEYIHDWPYSFVR